MMGGKKTEGEGEGHWVKWIHGIEALSMSGLREQTVTQVPKLPSMWVGEGLCHP